MKFLGKQPLNGLLLLLCWEILCNFYGLYITVHYITLHYIKLV